MKQERSHDQDITPARDALHRAELFAQDPGRLWGQAAAPVRTGNDAKRAIPRSAVIEVGAHGDQRLQHGHRRLDVQNTLLLGPPGALGVWDTCLDRDTQILVERDEPVVALPFVEERALNRHRVRGEERPDPGVRSERRRKPLAGGNIEQISGTGAAGGGAVEGRKQLGALVRSKYTGNRNTPGIVEHRNHSRPTHATTAFTRVNNCSDVESKFCATSGEDTVSWRAPPIVLEDMLEISR